MTEIIGIRFKEVGKIYYFDPNGEKFNYGDKVIVQTQNGIDMVTVAIPNKEIEDDGANIKPIIRRATAKDIKTSEYHKTRKDSAFKICEEKIKKNNLEMKLVDVEFSFDGSRVVFFFTADGRVDFRQLVKDLAQSFSKTRIELRQISTRDQCKMMGGLGICGRPFCCKSFLGDFQPVTIKTTKDQGFSLNPVKMSGACGRLMCCLKYESDAYKHLLSITPKKGEHVKIKEGSGVVLDVNPISGWMKVQLDDHPNSSPVITNRDELIENK